jgi:hypothetical protein
LGFCPYERAGSLGGFEALSLDLITDPDFV